MTEQAIQSKILVYLKSRGYYARKVVTSNHAGVPAARVLSQKGRELTVETLADIHKGDLLELNLQRENYSFGKEIPKGTDKKPSRRQVVKAVFLLAFLLVKLLKKK